MKVHVQKVGNISILRLRGRMVIGETDVLSRTVTSQSNASAVVLDLARLTRIDAAGLGVLLRLREHLELKGIEFRIMNVTRLIQQVLEMTKLNNVFEVTRERDLASLTVRVERKEVVREMLAGSFSEASEPNVTETGFAFDASISRS